MPCHHWHARGRASKQSHWHARGRASRTGTPEGVPGQLSAGFTQPPREHVYCGSVRAARPCSVHTVGWQWRKPGGDRQVMEIVKPCHGDRQAMPCQSMPSHAVPCHAMPSHAKPHHANSRHASSYQPWPLGANRSQPRPVAGNQGQPDVLPRVTFRCLISSPTS